jgi:hypothetical protein
MMNRRNRLRRGTLVLALLVLAAIVTGVAASATKTVLPKQLSGAWGRGGDTYGRMIVSPRGRVEIDQVCGTSSSSTCRGYHGHAKFSHVTAHRLTISYVPGLTVSDEPSCNGTGTYRWKFTNIQGASDKLKLTKIHDACKARVHLVLGTWLRTRTVS